LIIICNFSAQAKDEINFKNIEKGVDQIIVVQLKTGQAGQIGKTSDCYAELRKLDSTYPHRYKKFEY
jgi:hypothetical protein